MKHVMIAGRVDSEDLTFVMSSRPGRFGYPNRSPYSTVKWGLIGSRKTRSTEHGEHNIRPNAILPGAVDR